MCSTRLEICPVTEISGLALSPEQLQWLPWGRCFEGMKPPYPDDTFMRPLSRHGNNLGCRRWLKLPATTAATALWKSSLDWEFEQGKLMFPVNFTCWKASICSGAVPYAPGWLHGGCWWRLVKACTWQRGWQWSGRWEQFPDGWSAILRWSGEPEPSADTENMVQKSLCFSVEVLGELQEELEKLQNFSEFLFLGLSPWQGVFFWKTTAKVWRGCRSVI